MARRTRLWQVCGWLAMILFMLALAGGTALADDSRLPGESAQAGLLGDQGSISGVVYEEDCSTALYGVTIYAVPVDGGSQGITKNLSDGSYTILNLVPGQYWVWAADIDGYADAWYGGGHPPNCTTVEVLNSQDTGEIDFCLQATGTLSGTVYDQDGVTPLPGVNIGAGIRGSRHSAKDTTEDDGTYLLENLAPGDWWIKANATDTHAQEYYDDKQDWDSADPVAVVSNQNTSDIDFVLARSGSITGTVTTTDGVTPIEGILVWAYFWGTDDALTMAFTAADGSYTLSGLGPFDYRVSTWDVSRAYADQYYDGAAIAEGATPVTVVSEATTPNIDFALGELGAICGTVYRSDGVTGQGGVTVVVSHTVTGETHQTETDGDGEYLLKGLVPGDYILHSEQCGDYYPRWYDGANSPDQATPVTVDLDQTAWDIDLVLSMGGSISGSIYKEDCVTPVADATVVAYLVDGHGSGNTTTNADGSFSIGPIGPGEYYVAAFKQGEHPWVYYGNERLVHDSTKVQVEMDQDTSEVDFCLVASGAISGTVHDQDGVTPLQGVYVSASMDYQGQSAYTQADGSYLIADIWPGEFTVQTQPNATHAAQYYDGVPDYASATPVTVLSEQVTQDIDFALTRCGYISGTVYAADGVTPLESIVVVAYTVDGDIASRSTHSGSDGTYLLEGLHPDVYRVHAWDWQSVYAPEDYQEALWPQDATPVAVASEATTPGIDFTLDLAGSISGSVTDMDGSPVVGITVFAYAYGIPDGPEISHGHTDASGNYEILALPAADFWVGTGDHMGHAIAFYDGAKAMEDGQAVSVVATQDASGVDFVVGMAASISGHVFEADGTTPLPGAAVALFEDLSHGLFRAHAETTADAEGAYSFEGLPGGDWLIRSSAPGFMGGEAGTMAVDYGEDIPDVDMALDPVPIAPTSVALSGLPPMIEAGAEVTAQADVLPADTTTPISYTWSATDKLDAVQQSGLSDSRSFAWSAPGTKTVTVVADNGAGMVSDTAQIQVLPPPPTAPASVALSGLPDTLEVDEAVTAQADVLPADATTPITYTWSATDLAGAVHLAGLSDSQGHAWDSPGTKTVVVTACNEAGCVSDSRQVDVTLAADPPVQGPGEPWIRNYGTDAGGWTDQNTYPRAATSGGPGDLADIVAFGEESVYVSRSNGASFRAPEAWIGYYTPSGGGWSDLDTYPRMLGDVNGDGWDDVVGFGERATFVSLSNNTSFAPPEPWIACYGPSAGGWTSQDLYPRTMGDVNGDGMDDIVAFGNKATYVSLSTGTAFAPPVPWILLYGPAAGGWTSYDVYPRFVDDVDGDGLDDVIGFGNKATYVSYSTGTSFGPPTPWAVPLGPGSGGWMTQDGHPRLVGDIDDDGKADIVAFGENATYAWKSTTQSLGVQSWFYTNAHGWVSQNTYPRDLGDANGDGKLDIIGFGSDGTYVQLSP